VKNKVRPWNLLPLPHPKDFDPSVGNKDYFYKNFASQFIEDMIGMTNTGLRIDDKAVENLRKTITKVLADVEKRLGRNKIIRKYQEERAVRMQKAHAEKATQAIRVVGDFLRPYNPKDIIHRTWVVNTHLKGLGLTTDTREKWIIKDLKDYCKVNQLAFLKAIADKKNVSNYPNTKIGMKALAEHKLELWNRPRYEAAKCPVKVPPFNPGSSKQKQELFTMLNIESTSVSKTTGDDSWDREQVENLLKITEDEELIKILEAFVDHSFGGIIRSNFLKAFDSFTVDGVLYGNIKLGGAKSFRNTSNAPNLLNMPSSKSIYAKPLKKCFVPSKGRLIYAADLNALEDRVIANIAGDVNKISVFENNIDGHSLNALGYDSEKIPDLNKLFKEIDDESKGSYLRVTDEEGVVTYERENN